MKVLDRIRNSGLGRDEDRFNTDDAFHGNGAGFQMKGTNIHVEEPYDDDAESRLFLDVNDGRVGLDVEVKDLGDVDYTGFSTDLSPNTACELAVALVEAADYIEDGDSS